MTGLQKILGLAALALAATFLALQGGWRPAEPSPRLLPALEAQLGQVTKVVIVAGQTATLVHQEAGWAVAEKFDYPVDFGKLKALLGGLATADLVEGKTAKPELQGQLGLAATGEGDARGKAISIYLQAGEAPAFSLLVGKPAPARSGAYVRRAGEPRAWLVNKAVTASANPLDWLQQLIINVDAMEVQKVEIGLSRQPPLVAERTDDGGMALQGLPEGAQLSYPSVADNLARGLVNIRFQDVRPYDPADWGQASASRFTLANGDEVTARTREANERHFLHLTLVPTVDSPRTSQAALADWQYQISSYAYAQLNKTLADMLKAPESSADEEQ